MMICITLRLQDLLHDDSLEPFLELVLALNIRQQRAKTAVQDDEVVLAQVRRHLSDELTVLKAKVPLDLLDLIRQLLVQLADVLLRHNSGRVHANHRRHVVVIDLADAVRVQTHQVVDLGAEKVAHRRRDLQDLFYFLIYL